ncbi:MAG: hypothetical protein Q8N56_00670 [bacterium]|nr:hypothetical protein [bacterium]
MSETVDEKITKRAGKIIKTGYATIFFLATVVIAGIGSNLFVTFYQSLFVLPKDVKSIFQMIILFLSTGIVLFSAWYGFRLGKTVESFEQDMRELKSRMIARYQKEHLGNEPEGPEYIEININAYKDMLFDEKYKWINKLNDDFKRGRNLLIVGLSLLFLGTLIISLIFKAAKVIPQ